MVQFFDRVFPLAVLLAFGATWGIVVFFYRLGGKKLRWLLG